MSVLLDVAVDLVPLIDDVVEQHDERAAIVRHVAAQWLALAAHQRAATTLSDFVGEYVDRIDRSGYAGHDPDSLATGVAEQLVYAAWRRHVRNLGI